MVHALIGICLNCRVLCALCSRLDAKLLSSPGSHWKQPLYSYGVEARFTEYDDDNDDDDDDKRYKVWVVEENDQWAPDFLEEEEEPVGVSSELGSFRSVLDDGAPVIIGSDIPEVEESGQGFNVDFGRREGNKNSFGQLNDFMQREKDCGGLGSKVGADIPPGKVGHDSSFFPQVGPSFVLGGEVGSGDVFSFKVGKANKSRPNKIRMVSPSRKTKAHVGPVKDKEDLRPRKRSRSALDDSYAAGGQFRTNIDVGGRSDKGFEDFFLI
ncbi:hypothetical protein Hanom_Chr04g00289201 [Helianthus anomalus]